MVCEYCVEGVLWCCGGCFVDLYFGMIGDVCCGDGFGDVVFEFGCVDECGV